MNRSSQWWKLNEERECRPGYNVRWAETFIDAHIEVTNAPSISKCAMDICESDLLFLLGWQGVIMRFLGVMTRLLYKRQNFAGRSLRSLSRDLWRSTRYAHGVGKDMQKNFKRSPEKCQTSTWGEKFLKNA